MSTIRLRHVAQINPSTPQFDLLADDEPVTFLPLEAVWPGAGLDVSRTRPKREVANGYTQFREGDVLVPKITPTFEADRSTVARGLRQSVGAGTTELHTLRCGPSLNARYANYLVSSRPFLQGGKAEMKGVAGQQRVPDEWIREFRVPISELTRQRAIADFLDTETARIDALIEKKHRLARLMIQRFRAEVDSVLEQVTEQVPVRRVISRLTSGPRGWATHVADDGAAFLTIANVQREDVEMNLSKVVRVAAPDNAEARRTRAQEGDIVLSITADIGSVGIVRDGLGETYVSQHLALLTPDRCLPDLLAFALWSSVAQRQLDSARYGGTKTQLALEDVASVRVALPSHGEQLYLVQTLRNVRRRCLGTIEKLEKQIELLTEHRQALITAAVTGRIGVPGAAIPRA